MSIAQLELLELTHHCQCEIQNFFAGQDLDPCHCFELFRRCLKDRDQDAWTQAYTLFEPQVSRWVRSHRLFYSTGEDEAYFANRAFEKFWSAIPPKKFARFKDLKQLLSYLKMCVGSTVVDYFRKQERVRLGLEKSHQQPHPTHANPKLYQGESELWQFTKGMMNDKNERLVLHASFVLGLKPQEILNQYPDAFQEINEIYQTKENIIARLRRSDDLREILDKRINEGIT